MNKKLILVVVFAFTLIIAPIQSNAADTNSLATSDTIEAENDSLIQPLSADTYIGWQIASNDSKTRNVTLSKNATISFGVTIASSSARARIGIIDPDGTYHVKSITGAGSFTYTATSAGTHQIYCKNLSTSTFSVGINYSIY